MFGFGKRASYEERIRTALNENRIKEAESIARAAYLDGESEEHLLAWVAASMFERGISPAFDLLEAFVTRYPNSLHLPRVYLADLFSRSSRFDQATDLARYYLRQAKDSGALPDLSSKRILQDGVSRAFLLITSAYTTLGARSYSRRLLEYGLKFELADRWKDIINNELVQLLQELQSVAAVEVDKQWERLFATGFGADALYKKCIDEGFPCMAKRVDLLEANFRFNATFKVDEAEFFLIVMESNREESLLC
ncbi:hypothetical protein [Propionivibrio soli]|uniref:hypothetical protein n=1 Tax=Propionivibrio soli TaxID=2976531 RepID=UPI0021E8825A|nr:hypothetical protein [Propionivibrio soli]